jgi:hypothetical protein
MTTPRQVEDKLNRLSISIIILDVIWIGLYTSVVVYTFIMAHRSGKGVKWALKTALSPFDIFLTMIMITCNMEVFTRIRLTRKHVEYRRLNDDQWRVVDNDGWEINPMQPPSPQFADAA